MGLARAVTREVKPKHRTRLASSSSALSTQKKTLSEQMANEGNFGIVAEYAAGHVYL